MSPLGLSVHLRDWKLLPGPPPSLSELVGGFVSGWEHCQDGAMGAISLQCCSAVVHLPLCLAPQPAALFLPTAAGK